MVLSLLGAKVRGNESSIIPIVSNCPFRNLHYFASLVGNYGTFVPTYFRSQERKYHRWNFRPLVLSLTRTFVPWNERTTIKCAWTAVRSFIIFPLMFVHADGRFALTFRSLPSFARQFRIVFSQITLSQFCVSHFADYS